jgi:hypothetical protein
VLGWSAVLVNEEVAKASHRLQFLHIGGAW